MKGYVYVLISPKDKKQYIGSTNNIKRRLMEHNTGKVNSTKYRRPLKLKYLIEYNTIEEAARMEKRFKKSHDILRRTLEKSLK